MEDIKPKEEQTETVTEETSPETQTEVVTEGTDEETKETTEDIDFEKELENLEKEEEKPTELQKAERSLHFNAQRVKELGGDPHKIVKPETVETKGGTDVESVVKQQFAERDARSLAKTDAEYKVIMHYVRNKGLSVSEAHLLANKGRIERFAAEVKRSNVATARSSGPGRKVETVQVPARSPEEIAVLTRRGFKINPKTGTYQAKIYEEYWNGSEWASRKIKR